MFIKLLRIDYFFLIFETENGETLVRTIQQQCLHPLLTPELAFLSEVIFLVYHQR